MFSRLNLVAMTKTEVIKIMGSAAEVARFFGITAAAVGQWPDEEQIPELRELQLRLKRPDLYESRPLAEASQPAAKRRPRKEAA